VADEREREGWRAQWSTRSTRSNDDNDDDYMVLVMIHGWTSDDR